jgi:hypothetical protein
MAKSKELCELLPKASNTERCKPLKYTTPNRVFSEIQVFHLSGLALAVMKTRPITYVVAHLIRKRLLQGRTETEI